jgi:hypothetical protein
MKFYVRMKNLNFYDLKKKIFILNFIKKLATENDDDDDEMVGRNIHREMDEMINGEDL